MNFHARVDRAVSLLHAAVAHPDVALLAESDGCFLLGKFLVASDPESALVARASFHCSVMYTLLALDAPLALDTAHILVVHGHVV